MAASGENKFILAVDLGGGGPKVALVSQQGQFVARARRVIDTYYLPGGGVEQDPEQWWQSITDAVHGVLSVANVNRDDIVAVSCTGQWSVTVPVDDQGQHLMRAVHWMDSRGAPYTHAMTDGLVKFEGYGIRRLFTWLRLTGGAPTHSGADVLAHMLYIKHEHPEVYARTRAFLEPADYINLRLTGRVAASHGTIFPYLLTDNRDNLNVDYSDKLIAFSGIDREKLPELIPVDAVLGPLTPAAANEWGLNTETVVVAATSDSQAAVLGSGATEDFAGHLCIGSSSWLTCHVPFKKTDLSRYLATMPAAVRGRNMVVAEQGPAGKCLETMVERWFRSSHEGNRLEADGDRFREFAHGAEAVPPGSNGLMFLPWLNGPGPPVSDSYMRGGFLNQSLQTDAAHAYRAVMEGVANNIRWMASPIEKLIGRPFRSLNFIGGGARSELWCQIFADVLNRPIHQVEEPTWAIVRGAAFAGMLALKQIELDQIARTVAITKTYSPTAANRQVYDEMFNVFLTAYKVNKPVFKRLNAIKR